MSEDRYDRFLDEFGTRLRHAADASAPGAAGHGRLAVIPAAWRSTRVRIIAASTLFAAALAGVLLVIAPGSGSSSYLARAAAAITPPGPGSILYESWEATMPPEGADHPSRTFGPDQLWIEGAAPRRYRLIMQPNAESRPTGSRDIWGEYGGMFGFGGYPYWFQELEASVAGHPLEVGGELENPTEHAQPPRSLTFTPPNTLWSGRFRAPLGAPLPRGDEINGAVADPVTALREAITEGRAQEDGTSEFDGQTVERITFNPPTPPADASAPTSQSPQGHRSYALVDSETFKPVVIDFFGYYRFLYYEYLPATQPTVR